MNKKQTIQHQIGFIGSGNMAQSIVLGLLNNGWNAQSIHVSSPSASSKEWLHQHRITVAVNNSELVESSEIIIVATKPNQISRALENIHLNPQQCLISLAAGISTEFLQHLVLSEKPSHIIRAMPNTASLIGSGVCGLYANTETQQVFAEIAEAVFSTVGATVWVNNESQMDIVTAVSGSGPAYYFYMIEAIINTACELGLDADTAKTLAYETISGTAALLKSSDLTPNQLRRQVTSPRGTTAAAIDVFQQQQFEQIIKNAVTAAFERGSSLLKDSTK